MILNAGGSFGVIFGSALKAFAKELGQKIN